MNKLAIDRWTTTNDNSCREAMRRRITTGQSQACSASYRGIGVQRITVSVIGLRPVREELMLQKARCLDRLVDNEGAGVARTLRKTRRKEASGEGWGRRRGELTRLQLVISLKGSQRFVCTSIAMKTEGDSLPTANKTMSVHDGTQIIATNG